ncbi:MAG: hypothetical protein WBB48_13760 [Thermodesulfobacteriota bacterium]
MIRTTYLILLIFSIYCALSNKSLAQAETEFVFPISSVQELITQSGVEIDREITADNNGSLLINTDKPIKVELFELDKDFKNKRLKYKAQIRSENLTGTDELRGISFIELVATFPDGEELISRGPRVPISGTTDWRTAETVLYVDKGNAPENVKLNLIVEGQGKVWLDAVKLEAIPLRLNYLFWGHIVVWVVLIIYIYDLLRKNRQLKKELESFS